MLVLCGPAATGKDTIREELIKMGLQPAISHTTRPMRPGEIDGVHYHFCDKDWFLEQQNKNYFVNSTSYDTAYGKWYYGGSKEEMSGEKVAILNPDGIRDFKEADVECFIIGLQVNDDVLIKRLEARNWIPEEMNRRIERDKIDFADMDQFCDVIYDNNGNLTPHEMAEMILCRYKMYQEALANDANEKER